MRADGMPAAQRRSGGIAISGVTASAYLLFLFCNFLYFYFFVYTQPVKGLTADEFHIDYYATFYFPVNYDYLKSRYLFNDLAVGNWRYWSTENFFISFVYYYARRATHLDYDVLAFVINNALILGAYHYLRKILVVAGLSTRYAFLFFLNPQLIYYSQAITKEAPTLFFVAWLTYLVSQRQWLWLILATVIATEVRHQLLIFTGFLWFIYTLRRDRVTLPLAYLGSAGAATIWARMSVGEPMPAARFSKVVYDLNVRYGVGNLLLAPVTLLQWAYEQLRSLIFFTPDGLIDLYALRDIPAMFMLVWVLAANVEVFWNFRAHMARGERIMMSAIMALVLTLLIHSTIHQRYYFPIEVLLIMLGFAVRATRDEQARAGAALARSDDASAPALQPSHALP